MEFYVVGLCVIAMGGCLGYIGYNSYKSKDIEAKKSALDKTINDEEIKLSKNVFIKAREKGIVIGTEPNSEEIFDIIAKSYNIETIDELKKYFEKGKEIVEKDESETVIKIQGRDRQIEQKEFEEDERRTHIVGKEKYGLAVTKIYQDALKEMKKENNQKNVIDDSESEDNAKMIDDTYSVVSSYKNKIRKEKDKIDAFDKKICDESNMNENFKHLVFSNVKCLVLKSKNVRVSGYVKIDEKLKLLGSDALLDGSLKITILDEDNNELGYGYYSTGTYQEGSVVDSGFTEKDKRFSVICIINDYEKMVEGVVLKYRIEPVNMWLIEM